MTSEKYKTVTLKITHSTYAKIKADINSLKKHGFDTQGITIESDLEALIERTYKD